LLCTCCCCCCCASLAPSWLNRRHIYLVKSGGPMMWRNTRTDSSSRKFLLHFRACINNQECGHLLS
jgi:hypothetical protein